MSLCKFTYLLKIRVVKKKKSVACVKCFFDFKMGGEVSFYLETL